MTQAQLTKQPSKTLVLFAFAGLYIIWGSTYLAIKYALLAFQPFFLVAIRFIVAGTLLLAWCLVKGEKLPNFKSLLVTGFSGILLLVVGNGAVSWAEQYLTSGLTAIVVATVPLWFVLLDKRQWRYHFSNPLILTGIILGFAGVVILFAVKGTLGFGSDRLNLISFFVVIVGTIGWAIGSLISKYRQVEASATMKAAVQMLSAGLVALVIAMIRNEHRFCFCTLTVKPVLALIYLIVFGSLIGYMSYIWLLNVRPCFAGGHLCLRKPGCSSIPGLVVFGEAITSMQVMALLVILVGVILVSYKKKKGIDV